MVQVVNTVLIIAGIIAFVWIALGGGPGVVFIILAFTSKDRTKKRKYLKWLLVCFGGVFLLFTVFTLYSLFTLINTLFGFSAPTPVPQIPMYS